MHAGLKLGEKSSPFVAKVLKAAGKKERKWLGSLQWLKKLLEKKTKMARRSNGEKVVCIRMVTVMAFASLR